VIRHGLLSMSPISPFFPIPCLSKGGSWAFKLPIRCGSSLSV
jgi:hypothetical protein